MTLNILVTGGAGFIGSHLCETLIKKGNKILCLDNLNSGSMDNLPPVGDKFRFIKVDLNKVDLNKLLKGEEIDYIFHYSALVGVKRTLENPLAVLRDVDGIKNVLEYARLNNVKKVIYASSSEIYGEPINIPEYEDGIMNAKLPYAVTKLMGEKLFDAYYKEFGLNTCSLRFFNVYGSRQNYSPYGFVVGIFIKQALNNQPLTLFGDGSQTRDFTFIEDVIATSILAMRSNCVGSINIATGKQIKIIDLAKKIIKLCNKNVKLKFLPERQYEIKNRCADITKMRKVLEFKPQFSLEKGLMKTIEWYKTKTR